MTAEDPTAAEALARIIWTTSRGDEGTISATGANHVATAVLAAGYVPADRLASVQAERDGSRMIADDWRARAESAEAERDALRERVEALAGRYAEPDATPDGTLWRPGVVTDLRAALDVDRSTDPSAGSERA